MSRLLHRVAKLEHTLRPRRIEFEPFPASVTEPMTPERWARRHEEPEAPDADFPSMKVYFPGERGAINDGR